MSSMQDLPCPKMVWPSPSLVSSTPFDRRLATSTPDSYGVAGSPVVLMTRIGGDPGAVTGSNGWGGVGQRAHRT